MFYFALKDIKENITQKLQDELVDQKRIAVRGTNINEVKLPSELLGKLFPVNLLANKYCSTNRDFALRVVEKIPKPITWRSSGFSAVYRPLVDKIKSRGLMTKRNKTAGLINSEWIMIFRKCDNDTNRT